MAAAAVAAAASSADAAGAGSDVGIALRYLSMKHLRALQTMAASFVQLGQRKMYRAGAKQLCRDFLWLPSTLVCCWLA